jgi:hypothetical protein
VTSFSPSRIPRRSSSILLGRRALEQTAPVAEERRDDMELDLVEDAGGKCELRGSGVVSRQVTMVAHARGSAGRTAARPMARGLHPQCAAARAFDRKEGRPVRGVQLIRAACNHPRLFSCPPSRYVVRRRARPSQPRLLTLPNAGGRGRRQARGNLVRRAPGPPERGERDERPAVRRRAGPAR